MGCHGRGNQRIFFIFAEEVLCSLQRVGRGLGIGHWKANHRLPQHCAHASLFSSLCNDLFEIIHVGIRGGATQHHFKAGQAGAPTNKIGIHELGFHREDIFFQPILQLQIVGNAPQ